MSRPCTCQLILPLYCFRHWLINNIDTKAKCRLLKILTCKGTLRTPAIPPSPSHCILYTCIQYTYSHREGARGIVEPERRFQGQQFTKLVETPTWLNVSPFYLINTCREVLFQVNFFRWRHFALVSIKLISPGFQAAPMRCCQCRQLI